MQSRRTRLDRFIRCHTGLNKREVRHLLARGRVKVDHCVASTANQVIEQFSRVTLDGAVLRDEVARYLMLNKPAGVVSATRDPRHKTVIDCLDRTDKKALHLVGRLDFNSTGLILLTNDGAWSRRITAPKSNLQKVYQVSLENPLTEDYIAAFAQGMVFSYEGIHTQPAILHIESRFTAQVTLTEGRYHQIKRMFGRFDNRVVSLHRTSIGTLELDSHLAPGESRDLSAGEVASLGRTGRTNSVD